MATSAQPQAAEGNTGENPGSNNAPPESPPPEGTATESTDVATAPPQSQRQLAIGSLPEDVKNAIILQRQKNLVIAEIAGTNWGSGLSLDVRRAVADWAERAGLDPATELDVLGGRFYKNAQYYLRKLSEMIEAGIVDYAFADHVEIDPRLKELATNAKNPATREQAIAEMERRTMMRIQHAVPDAAVSACVFRVKLKHMPMEFGAAKWCGGGTRKKDPVGDDFPVETSESRSARRTMRLIASQNPAFHKLVEVNDDDSIDAQITPDIRDALKKVASKEDFVAPQAPRMRQLPAGDPYAVGDLIASPAKEKVVDPFDLPVPAVATKPAPAPTAKAAAPPLDQEFIDDRDIANQ